MRGQHICKAVWAVLLLVLLASCSNAVDEDESEGWWEEWDDWDKKGADEDVDGSWSESSDSPDHGSSRSLSWFTDLLGLPSRKPREHIPSPSHPDAIAAPVGTLVTVWQALPAKSDGGRMWGPPPSQYAWSSTAAQSSSTASLLFSLQSASVVGRDNKRTPLKLTTTCPEDYVPQCKGQVVFSKEATIMGFWAILSAPEGSVFKVYPPFKHMEASVHMPGTLASAARATFTGQSFETGPAPRLAGPHSVGFPPKIEGAQVGPFAGTSKVSFRTLTLKVSYSGASVSKGDVLTWSVPGTVLQLVGNGKSPVLRVVPERKKN